MQKRDKEGSIWAVSSAAGQQRPAGPRHATAQPPARRRRPATPFADRPNRLPLTSRGSGTTEEAPEPLNMGRHAAHSFSVSRPQKKSAQPSSQALCSTRAPLFERSLPLPPSVLETASGRALRRAKASLLRCKPFFHTGRNERCTVRRRAASTPEDGPQGRRARWHRFSSFKARGRQEIGCSILQSWRVARFVLLLHRPGWLA